MAYRTLTRVLGETSLERKCRFLFGACILVLVMGSFWWYGKQTESLVQMKSQNTAQQFVGLILSKMHYVALEDRANQTEFTLETSESMDTVEYDYQMLSLENIYATDQETLGLDEWELTNLPLLKENYSKHLTDLDDEIAKRWEEEEKSGRQKRFPKKGFLPEGFVKEIEPVSLSRYLDGEYIYYQPIYWPITCDQCHFSQDRSPSLSATAQNPTETEEYPRFRVAKISLPNKEIQDAINLNRAFLLTAALTTVFLSMSALYLIVRYVIVKPLAHLQEVSEEVGRGNLALRADLSTNDEFENLATSFNKMLRHLVDAQNELKTVNRDLDFKVDELAQANLKLYQMNRFKSEFLANMSHELRTPLNSIIGFSDILRSARALDEKQKRYAQNIQNSGHLLLEMINDILDLAKLEANKMDCKPTEFDLVAVVRAQCDLVQALAETKKLILKEEFLGDFSGLYQDQTKIQQILTNLLSNAIKFTPEGGQVVVRAQRQDEKLYLAVIDSGIGIPEHEHETIFEKFRQSTDQNDGDNLTREFSGTGLGLSIVKEMCKLLGGTVSLTSELGMGSTFEVILPWHYEPGDAKSEFQKKVDQVVQNPIEEFQRYRMIASKEKATPPG
ncbi:MAG: HAMP domain-containing histidine kinase [Pirellulaceae bacterium]|nr:HAMP domain-containing histidine kinase [Pirellulaceae bacterium]